MGGGVIPSTQQKYSFLLFKSLKIQSKLKHLITYFIGKLWLIKIIMFRTFWYASKNSKKKTVTGGGGVAQNFEDMSANNRFFYSFPKETMERQVVLNKLF